MIRVYLLTTVSFLLLTSGCSDPVADPGAKASPDQAPASQADAAPAGADEPAAASTPDATAAPGDEAPPAHVVVRTDNLPQPIVLTSEDWPQFRGALRDGVSQAQSLANQWPADGPPVLWQTSLGQGYSSPAVVAERVYLNDYDEQRNVWMVRCLALADGEELWRYEAPKRIRPNHAITRSVPATDGGFVFSIDPKCELHCIDARDGSLIWKTFLPAAYDSQIPAWYNGQCPLLDEDRLIIAPGGRALMAALDKATGETIWETPNPAGHLMSHASIMPLVIDGVRQYAYLTLKGVVGVAAADGRQLWEFPWQFNTAVPTTPLPLGDGKLLLTSGYHARTVVCQVKHDNEQWTAEEVVSLPPPTGGWNSEVHTPIVHRGFVFGVGKKQRGMWTCLNDNAKELWTSGRKASFGMGGYLLADGKFFVLEDRTGAVRMLDAAADEYRELGSFTVLSGPDVWAPPVVSHGKLLVRDLQKLVCLDIADHDAAGPVARAPSDLTK
ncbi:MAG: PQQ-binding-like beta-propeller repeat protein [Planctomycetales bacterium]|nr:PQQ-binding-like beta-propeller repeat protein [Planctomycetales bacterium]